MKQILLSTLLFLTLCFGCGRGSQAQTKPGTTTEQGNKKPRIVALKSGEPESLAYGADGAVGPNRVRFLATGEDTGGEWSLVELTEMPGTKTTWHRHNRTDQAYYVLEGVLTARIESTTYTLPAGSYIVIPRGTPHGHGNAGKVPLRVLLTNTPAGFEHYFKERAELLKIMKPTDPEFGKKMRELRAIFDAEELGVWEMQQ